MANTTSKLFQNPVVQIGTLGAGTALLIAISIVATEEPTGPVVGPGPDSEVVASLDTSGEENGLPGAVIELSGNAVTPEDTDVFVQPVASSDQPESDTEGAGSLNGVEITEVDDPDNGAKGGPDPDGGAGDFYPKPSGPTGIDGETIATD